MELSHLFFSATLDVVFLKDLSEAAKRQRGGEQKQKHRFGLCSFCSSPLWLMSIRQSVRPSALRLKHVQRCTISDSSCRLIPVSGV